MGGSRWTFRRRWSSCWISEHEWRRGWIASRGDSPAFIEDLHGGIKLPEKIADEALLAVLDRSQVRKEFLDVVGPIIFRHDAILRQVIERGPAGQLSPSYAATR